MGAEQAGQFGLHGETGRNVINTSTMPKPFTLALFSAATLAAASAAFGQPSAVQRRLAAATRLECSFSVLATGTWSNSAPSAAVTAAELETSYFDIDVDEGTAEADSAFGASFISARLSQGYLHLLHMSDAGPLYVTTVFPRSTSDGRLLAVHTRLEYSPTVIPGFTSRPEMYVGSCVIPD
jgi:hypothetical protein